ncbi:MAG TPA: YciI family protein [Gaiellaceae bacterium]|nr:YciI family protein [Gaiellaceae bacterium]
MGTTPKEETMKYALLIYPKDARAEYDALSADDQRAITEEYVAIGGSPGMYGGEQLQPAETATTVRVEDSQALITDGPYADTKEILGGFYLFEAASLDAALEIAARVPAARMGGAIEVRPLVER